MDRDSVVFIGLLRESLRGRRKFGRPGAESLAAVRARQWSGVSILPGLFGPDRTVSRKVGPASASGHRRTHCVTRGDLPENGAAILIRSALYSAPGRVRVFHRRRVLPLFRLVVWFHSGHANAAVAFAARISQLLYWWR
jgi:hypothetical protein